VQIALQADIAGQPAMIKRNGSEEIKEEI